MGKALMGTHVPSESLRLLDEVRVLRQRVAELEAALDEALRARPADDEGVEDVPAPADRELDRTAVGHVEDREPATT